MSNATATVPVVVVGIDGSPSSARLLGWAVRHAHAIGGKLRVVLAWQFPELPGYHPARVESDLSEAEEELVAGLLAEALHDAGLRPGELPVETTIQEGGPVRILLARAQDADLLVLGQHGVGHDGSKLLGSVTQSCVMQAPCPVVVVPTKPAT